eukprot:3540066-Pyramimonas_sp.AAC.1
MPTLPVHAQVVSFNNLEVGTIHVPVRDAGACSYGAAALDPHPSAAALAPLSYLRVSPSARRRHQQVSDDTFCPYEPRINCRTEYGHQPTLSVNDLVVTLITRYPLTGIRAFVTLASDSP